MNAPSQSIDNDDEQPSVLSNWLNALSHPGVLIHAIEEVFNSCISTRPWRRLIIFSPALLVLGGLLGLIVWGRSVSRETLVARYAQLAQEELDRLETEDPAQGAEAERSTVLMKEERTSAFSDMLFRRLLQLNDENARTRYLVAVQMAKSQRLPQARQLMEEIAPLSNATKGYEPAHAWLAIDLLSRQPLDKSEQTRLLEHLERIQAWDGTGSGLLAIYANVMASQGKHADALEVMSRAAKKDPGLQSAYAIMARKFNMPKIADEVSMKARKELKEAISKPDAKMPLYIQLASLELTEENYQAALQVTREGLNRLDKNNEQLKYLGSEALRLMYRKSIRKTSKGVEFNLGLLDLAMKEFPANQNLTTEIALLEDMGVEASGELKALMEQQLANGQATALAHLILANQEIKAGRMADAIKHLELTVNAAPTHPVALNNLALALALTDSAQVKRSEELIGRALAVDGRNAELYDSQGQIRLIAGRPLDAVESLEKAIGINPNRTGTRELIIKAYREAGLEDLAVQQEKSLEKLKADLAKEEADRAQAKLNESKPKAAEPTVPKAAEPKPTPSKPDNALPPTEPPKSAKPQTSPAQTAPAQTAPAQTATPKPVPAKPQPAMPKPTAPQPVPSNPVAPVSKTPPVASPSNQPK